jgi:hypothetical protein
MSTTQKKLRWWFLPLVSLIFLFIPFPTTRVPEYRLQVFDSDNRPSPHVLVEFNWHDYDYGREGWESVRSDQNAEVVFPEQRLWASTASRIFFPSLAVLSELAHGGSGYTVFIRVFDQDLRYVSSSDDQIHWYDKRDSIETLPRRVVGTKQDDWKP